MADRVVDLEQLRALAEAATPGPWCWEAHGEKSNDWTVGYAEDDNGQPLTGEIREPDHVVEAVGYSEPEILRKRVVIERENAPGYADAAFIAAANPTTVLALVERVRAAEKERDAYRDASHLLYLDLSAGAKGLGIPPEDRIARDLVAGIVVHAAAMKDSAEAAEALVRVLEGALRRIVDAYDECDSNRGAFSCHEPHDTRCPKSRDKTGEQWVGEWVCKCGREELDAAMDEARAALTSPATPEGK